MLINWFTIAAQIVNFLVLVWLLKHFLYGRILNLIDSREKKIVAGLAEAAAKEQEAGQNLARYQAQLAEFERQQETMLADAKREAQERRQELLQAAREQVHTLQAKWQEDLERERNTFLTELRGRAATEMITITQRVVADLACLDVQQCAVQVFLDKIRLLENDAWKNIAQGDMLLRSAYDLPEDTRAEIQQIIEERLHMPVSLRFERAPEMGLGVELRGNGRRIGWNSSSYLEAMEQDLKTALEHHPEHASAEAT